MPHGKMEGVANVDTTYLDLLILITIHVLIFKINKLINYPIISTNTVANKIM